ncbi:uncharacterized protein [Diadema antillarum]|uniref:uncharacterized protein n=1 Tax=Diadema antillarum TaxID=105358 RepID=UPI003A887F22
MTLDVLLEKAVPTVCDDKSSDDDHESKEIPDNKENIPPSSVPLKTPLDILPESVSAISKDLPTSKEDVESLSASENEDDKDSTTSGEYDTSMPKPVNHEYFHISQNVQINGDGKRTLTPIIEDGEQGSAATDNDHAKPFDDSSLADNEVNNNAAPHLAEPKDTKEEVLPCQVQEEVTMESVEPVEHTNNLMCGEKVQDLVKPEVEPKFEEPFDRSYTSTSGSASTTSDNNTDTQGAESEQDEMTNGSRTNVPVTSAQDDTILDGLPAATGKLLLEVIVTDKSGESQGDNDDDDDEDDDVFVSEKSEPHVEHRTDSPENEYTDLSNPSVSDYAELVVSPKTEEPIKEGKSSKESSSSEDDYEELLQDQSITPSPTKAIKYSEFLQEAKRMLEEDDSPKAARHPEAEDKTVLPATAALPSLSPKQDWHEFTVSLEAKHKLGIVQITKKEEVFIYEEVLEWREPRRSADLDEDSATLRQDRNDTEGVMGQDNLESSSERNDDQPLSLSTLPVTLSRGLSTSSQSSDGNKGAGDDTERPLPTSTVHVPTSTETSKILDIAVAAKRQVASPVKDINEHHSSDSSEGEQFEKDKVDVKLEFREKCRSRSISSDSESDSEQCHPETRELKGEGQLANNLFAAEVLLPMQQCQDLDSEDDEEQYSPSNIHLQMDPTDLFHAEIVVPEESSVQKQSPKTSEEDQKDEALETQPEDDRSDIVDRVVVIDLGPNLRAPSPITSSEDEHTEDGVTLGVVSVADTVYPSTKFQVPPSSTPDSQTEKDGTTLHSTTLLDSHTSPAEEDIRDIPPIEITAASPDPTILHCYLEWTEPRQPLESPVYSDEKEFTESDLEEALFDVSAAPETQSAVLEAESNEQEPVVIEEFLSLKREEYTVMLAPKVMPDITLEIDARDLQADDGPNTVSQNYLAGDTSEKDTDPENESAEVLAELDDDMAEPTATGEHQPFVTSIEIPVGRIQESVESAAAARPESSSESGSSSPVMLELRMPSNQPDLDEPEKKYVTVKVKVQAPKPRSVQVYFDEPQKQREVFAVHQQKGGKKKSRNSSTQIDMDDSEIPDSLVECSVASDVSFPSFSANGDVRFVSTPDDDNAPLQASFILDITDPHGSSEDEIDDIKCEEMLPSPKPMTESIQCETHLPNLKAPPRAKLSLLLEEYEDDLILKEPEEAEEDEHATSHKMQDDKVNVDEPPVEATRAVMPAGRELQLDSESIFFSSGDDVEPQVQSHPVPSDLVSVETDSTEAASEVASYTISAARPGSQETLIRANIIQVDQVNPLEARDAVSSPVEDGQDDLAEEKGKDIIYIPGASHLHVERTPMVDLLQEYDDCLHFTHYTDSDESEKDELGEVIISGAEIIEEEAVVEIRYLGMDEASPGLIQATQYNGDSKSNANLHRLTPVVTEHTEREVVEVHSSATMSSNSTILYKREEYREIVTSDWSFSKGIAIEHQQSDLDSSVETEERYPSFFTPTKTNSEPFFTDDSKQDEREDPHFSQGLSDMVVEVGDLAIFQCHVGGNPLPDVKWYKDGHPVEPSSNVSTQVMRFQDMFVELVINSARLEDGGRYKVEIINPHGVVSSSAFLTVRSSSSSETESDDSSEDAASPGDDHSHSSHEGKDQTRSSERPQQLRWPDDASSSSTSNSCLELSSAPAAELPNLSDPAASLPPSQSASDTPLSPCSSGQLDDIASVKQGLNQEPSSACGEVLGETPCEASVHALDEFLDSVPMEDQDVHDSVSKVLPPSPGEKGDKEKPVEEVPKTEQPETKQLQPQVEEQTDNLTQPILVEKTPKELLAEELEQATFAEQPEVMPPKFVKPIETVVAGDGEPVKFVAMVTGKPRPEVKWFVDDTEIKDEPEYEIAYSLEGVASLFLPEVIPEDEGVYICKAINEAGVATCSAELFVEEESSTEVDTEVEVSSTKKVVTVTQEVQKTVVEEEKTETVETVMVVEPSEATTYIAIGNYLAESDQVMSMREGEQLTILDDSHGEWWMARRDATGEEGWVPKGYLATAVQYDDHLRSQLEEVVKEMPIDETPFEGEAVAPEILKPLETMKAKDGKPITMTCHIKGTPTPTLAWFRQSTPIPATEEFKMEYDGEVAKLTIEEVYPEDSGKYTCVAKNQAGTASTSAELLVEVALSDAESDGAPSRKSLSRESTIEEGEGIKPAFMTVAKSMVVESGREKVCFEFRLIAAPRPQIAWFKDDQPVEETPRRRMSMYADVHLYHLSLELTDIQPEDEGKYRIVATNKEGKAVASVSLEVTRE